MPPEQPSPEKKPERSLKEQHKDAEKRLEKAVSNRDFGKAEEIQNEIDEIEAQMEEDAYAVNEKINEKEEEIQEAIDNRNFGKADQLQDEIDELKQGVEVGGDGAEKTSAPKPDADTNEAEGAAPGSSEVEDTETAKQSVESSEDIPNPEDATDENDEEDAFGTPPEKGVETEEERQEKIKQKKRELGMEVDTGEQETTQEQPSEDTAESLKAELSELNEKLREVGGYENASPELQEKVDDWQYRKRKFEARQKIQEQKQEQQSRQGEIITPRSDQAYRQDIESVLEDENEVAQLKQHISENPESFLGMETNRENIGKLLESPQIEIRDLFPEFGDYEMSSARLIADLDSETVDALRQDDAFDRYHQELAEHSFGRLQQNYDLERQPGRALQELMILSKLLDDRDYAPRDISQREIEEIRNQIMSAIEKDTKKEDRGGSEMHKAIDEGHYITAKDLFESDFFGTDMEAKKDRFIPWMKEYVSRAEEVANTDEDIERAFSRVLELEGAGHISEDEAEEIMSEAR